MKIKNFIKHKYTLGAILIILFVLLDQITKLIAYQFKEGLATANHVFIKYILEFSYSENPDASLGLLGNFDHKHLVFILITIFALGLFGYFFKDIDFKKRKVFSFSIVFFIAGTLGNAIDRLFRGFVIDFLHFPFFDFLYKVGLSNFDNNIADIVLTFAIILFAIDLFFIEPKFQKKLKEQSADETNNHS
ncbi:MAG: signal peptidase II [Acholeplasmataceae bacterium]